MEWRFTLIDYTFNAAGETTVIEEPNGWNDIAIKVKRDKKAHGLFFDIAANSLEFVGEGYNIVKTAYDAQGVFANTKILVEINCAENYRTFYEGRLRYESAEFLFSDYCMAKIPVEQVGCLQTFINRQEMEVDLHKTTSLNGTTALTPYAGLSEEIDLVSKPITLISSGTYDSTTYHTAVGSSALGRGTVGTFFLSVTKQDLEIFSPIDDYRNGDGNDVDIIASTARLYLEPTLEIELTQIACAIETIDFDVQFNGNWTVALNSGTGTGTYQVMIGLVHQTVAGVTTVYQMDYQTAALSGLPDSLPVAINYQNTLNVSNGDKFWFVGVVQVTSSTACQVDYLFTPTGTCTFETSVDSTCDSTPCKVSFVNEALSRTSEIITDDCLRVYSEYFGRTDSQPYALSEDGCGSLEAITNGLLIRRATRNDGSEAKVFTSFKHLFDGLNAIHNIGYGIEEDTQGRDYMLRVEPVDYWYPFQVIHTIDLPKEIKVNFDESRCYLTIKIGYENWESEYSGGLDEFLTNREYRTELTTVDNSLEQVSKLIASGYAIEVTRRTGQTTEDFTYDNDIFIICLERGGYTGFEVEILNNLTATNVLSTTNIYNVRISPVRNLLRWFKTIASGWTKVFATTSKDLLFNSGEGNYIAQLDNNAPDSCWVGDDITENQTVDKNSEADTTPIWEAETIELEYPLSWDDFLTIKANPKGLVQINLSSETLYGWIEELNYKPNDGLATWKLLKAYDAENSLCIDYDSADYDNSDYCAP